MHAALITHYAPTQAAFSNAKQGQRPRRQTWFHHCMRYGHCLHVHTCTFSGALQIARDLNYAWVCSQLPSPWRWACTSRAARPGTPAAPGSAPGLLPQSGSWTGRHSGNPAAPCSPAASLQVDQDMWFSRRRAAHCLPAAMPAGRSRHVVLKASRSSLFACSHACRQLGMRGTFDRPVLEIP